MTHDENQELVSQYIDEELGEEDGEALFRHLGECVQCRDFLRSSLVLRKQILKTKESAPSTLRPEAAERVKQTVERDLLVLAWQRKVRLPVAASVAFILLLGGILFSSGSLQEQSNDQTLQGTNFPADFRP